MSAADGVIRWSAALAALGVARLRRWRPTSMPPVRFRLPAGDILISHRAQLAAFCLQEEYSRAVGKAWVRSRAASVRAGAGGLAAVQPGEGEGGQDDFGGQGDQGAGGEAGGAGEGQPAGEGAGALNGSGGEQADTPGGGQAGEGAAWWRSLRAAGEPGPAPMFCRQPGLRRKSRGPGKSPAPSVTITPARAWVRFAKPQADRRRRAPHKRH